MELQVNGEKLPRQSFDQELARIRSVQPELELEQASLLATIHGFGQIIGVLAILPLSDYLGRKKTIIISNTFITSTGGAIFHSILVNNCFVIVVFKKAILND